MTETVCMDRAVDADTFTDRLVDTVLKHGAVSHPYLEKLAAGTLPDPWRALQDYAYQYNFYSQQFTKFLDAILANLTKESHRALLLENKEDEEGTPGAERIEDRPHKDIFADFKRQLGIDEAYAAKHEAAPEVLKWCKEFMELCGSKNEAEAVAAFGLGTEFIVPHFYPYIIEAIEKHTDLGVAGSLFFRIHVVCDEDHGAETLKIIKDLAEDPANQPSIWNGAMKALDLRAAFWSALLERAQKMPPSKQRKA